MYWPNEITLYDNKSPMALNILLNVVSKVECISTFDLTRLLFGRLQAIELFFMYLNVTYQDVNESRCFFHGHQIIMLSKFANASLLYKNKYIYTADIPLSFL